MNNEETFEEICRLLNDATKSKRRQVEEDLIYKQCIKENDFPAAYRVAYGIIFGSAKNRTEMRRMMKRRRKTEREGEFI
jgi:hypothetical protein